MKQTSLSSARSPAAATVHLSRATSSRLCRNASTPSNRSSRGVAWSCRYRARGAPRRTGPWTASLVHFLAHDRVSRQPGLRQTHLARVVTPFRRPTVRIQPAPRPRLRRDSSARESGIARQVHTLTLHSPPHAFPTWRQGCNAVRSVSCWQNNLGTLVFECLNADVAGKLGLALLLT